MAKFYTEKMSFEILVPVFYGTEKFTALSRSTTFNGTPWVVPEERIAVC
jgi:hypothetical protein